MFIFFHSNCSLDIFETAQINGSIDIFEIPGHRQILFTVSGFCRFSRNSSWTLFCGEDVGD